VQSSGVFVVAAEWWEGLHGRSEPDLLPLLDLTAPVLGGLEFEILESDAELLTAHVGTPRDFYIDDTLLHGSIGERSDCWHDRSHAMRT
jgi:hypothetical protein